MYSLSLPSTLLIGLIPCWGGRGVSLLFLFYFRVCILVYKKKGNLRLISVVYAVYQCGIFLCVCVLKRIKPHAHAVEILWSALAK